MSAGKLPEGWVNTTIGNISVKCSQRVPDENEQFIYVDIGSINRELKIIENPQYLIGKDAPSRARKEIKKDDIIVSLTRPNLNAVALVNEKYDEQIASTGFEVIRPILVESCYIFALVRSRHFIDSISGLVQGALYPAAKSSDVQSFELPLPPLAEQKFIAEKVDTLLAQVDSTKARLENIPQILKLFRQAVLAAAVNGELTKNFAQDKKDEVALDKIASIIDPHPSHRTPKIDDAGIPYIGIGDIKSDGKIDFTNARKVSVDILKEHTARYTLNDGDFIFGKIGTLGKACVLPIGIRYTLSANVILIQPIKEKVSPDFLRYFLSSPLTMQKITQQANSTSQAAFGIKKMRAFKCNLPSLTEQTEIVRRVEQFFAYADTIEKQVNNALARVNNLTQSILAKALRGELTAQWRAENPDLISGENSATALLEKIKAERAASGSKKNARKKA